MKGFGESNKQKRKLKNNKKIKNVDKNLELYNRAINFQKKGSYSQAAEIFNILIKSNYHNEQIFLNYATVCQYLKDTKGAVKLFKEAIKINPNNSIPFFKMGFILNNYGRFYEAYPFAKRAVVLNPKS